ncbi:Phosphatidate cytidylyltransferase [Bacteroidales bacterium Barb4]|nr:Phosphatidate cytidylyltransferase [Bacteroidales bacterium Barb4]
MNNLIVRALTGSVYIAVILAAVCLHPVPFLIVFAFITAALLREFHELTGRGKVAPLKRILYPLGGGYLFAASFAYAHHWCGATVFLPYILFLMSVLVIELYAKEADPVKNWSVAFFGQLYCAGTMSLLNFSEATPFVLALFVIVWLNDTGAYLVGSRFGRHRLFERISPKKSWEGFWGGFAMAVLASQVFAFCNPEISRFHWLGLSVVIVIFATWGDLTESLLKRTLERKDSGSVLPGHGGLLDRFDSILLASPAACIYIELFMK